MKAATILAAFFIALISVSEAFACWGDCYTSCRRYSCAAEEGDFRIAKNELSLLERRIEFAEKRLDSYIQQKDKTLASYDKRIEVCDCRTEYYRTEKEKAVQTCQARNPQCGDTCNTCFRLESFWERRVCANDRSCEFMKTRRASTEATWEAKLSRQQTVIAEARQGLEAARANVQRTKHKLSRCEDHAEDECDDDGWSFWGGGSYWSW